MKLNGSSTLIPKFCTRFVWLQHGKRIFPFQYENIPGKECIDLPIVDQYVVFADYQPDTLEFICNPQYHSYEDILKEFKGKLEKYLPENFPWDERIGRYSYAVYA